MFRRGPRKEPQAAPNKDHGARRDMAVGGKGKRGVLDDGQAYPSEIFTEESLRNFFLDYNPTNASPENLRELLARNPKQLQAALIEKYGTCPEMTPVGKGGKGLDVRGPNAARQPERMSDDEMMRRALAASLNSNKGGKAVDPRGHNAARQPEGTSEDEMIRKALEASMNANNGSPIHGQSHSRANTNKGAGKFMELASHSNPDASSSMRSGLQSDTRPGTSHIGTGSRSDPRGGKSGQPREPQTAAIGKGKGMDARGRNAPFHLERAVDDESDVSEMSEEEMMRQALEASKSASVDGHVRGNPSAASASSSGHMRSTSGKNSSSPLTPGRNDDTTCGKEDIMRRALEASGRMSAEGIVHGKSSTAETSGHGRSTSPLTPGRHDDSNLDIMRRALGVEGNAHVESNAANMRSTSPQNPRMNQDSNFSEDAKSKGRGRTTEPTSGGGRMMRPDSQTDPRTGLGHIGKGSKGKGSKSEERLEQREVALTAMNEKGNGKGVHPLGPNSLPQLNRLSEENMMHQDLQAATSKGPGSIIASISRTKSGPSSTPGPSSQSYSNHHLAPNNAIRGSESKLERSIVLPVGGVMGGGGGSSSVMPGPLTQQQRPAAAVPLAGGVMGNASSAMPATLIKQQMPVSAENSTAASHGQQDLRDKEQKHSERADRTRSEEAKRKSHKYGSHKRQRSADTKMMLSQVIESSRGPAPAPQQRGPLFTPIDVDDLVYNHLESCHTQRGKPRKHFVQQPSYHQTWYGKLDDGAREAFWGVVSIFSASRCAGQECYSPDETDIETIDNARY